MKISKILCMLIAGLAIIGFTTVGMAAEEHPKAEHPKAESEVQIEYGAKPELKSGEKEAKAEEKE